MTAQPSEVLRAYAFVVRYRGRKSHTSGVVASSFAEALDQMQERYSDLQQNGEVGLFNCASAMMELAHIDLWDGKFVTGMGSFAFLEGMFFGEYNGERVVYGCGKEKTRDGWFATVYGGSFKVKSL